MMYQVGYSNPPRQVTLDELNNRPDWLLIDPEVRRRLLAMMDASGGKVGIGAGGRSAKLQEAVFIQRHRVVPGPTPIFWDGRYWELVLGMAPASPPGNSYHEQSTPDGFALAADLIGDLSWVHIHAAAYDLADFSLINKEPWHVQPVEIPTARRNYNPNKAKFPLHVWNPPPPPKPPEEDARMNAVVGLEENHADPRRWLFNGVSIHLLKSEAEFDRLRLLFPLHPTYNTLAAPLWMTGADIAEYV